MTSPTKKCLVVFISARLARPRLDRPHLGRPGAASRPSKPPGSGCGGLARLLARGRTRRRSLPATPRRNAVAGLAWLELSVGSTEGGTTTSYQRALFHPRGLAGQLYWWSVFPFHGIIFGAMQRNIAKAAERS